MAKEQWHNWGRYAMLAISILGVGVGIYIKIHDNTKDNTRQDKNIVMNIGDIKANERRIDKTELSQNTLQKTNESIASALIRIETGQKGFYDNMTSQLEKQRTAQNTMVTDIAVISEKVNTLTKDD